MIKKSQTKILFLYNLAFLFYIGRLLSELSYLCILTNFILLWGEGSASVYIIMLKYSLTIKNFEILRLLQEKFNIV